MAHIHDGAVLIGVLRWTQSHNTVSLHASINHNLGTSIVWRTLNNEKPRRTTGRNISRLARELADALDSGEAEWAAGEYSHAARAKLMQLAK